VSIVAPLSERKAPTDWLGPAFDPNAENTSRSGRL